MQIHMPPWVALALCLAPIGAIVMLTIRSFLQERRQRDLERQWPRELQQRMESLVGKTIAAWKGVELALAESEDPKAIVWQHDSIPFLQCDTLDLSIGESWLRFGSAMYGVNSDFGVELGDARGGDMADAVSSYPNPIFRRRVFSCLPTGVVRRVDCSMESERTISSVKIEIENSIIEVRSGEVYDESNIEFRVVAPNESLLIQVNGLHPEFDAI